MVLHQFGILLVHSQQQYSLEESHWLPHSPRKLTIMHKFFIWYLLMIIWQIGFSLLSLTKKYYGVLDIYHDNAMFFGICTMVFLNHHLNNMVNVNSNHYVVLYNELPRHYHLITVFFL